MFHFFVGSMYTTTNVGAVYRKKVFDQVTGNAATDITLVATCTDSHNSDPSSLRDVFGEVSDFAVKIGTILHVVFGNTTVFQGEERDYLTFSETSRDRDFLLSNIRLSLFLSSFSYRIGTVSSAAVYELDGGYEIPYPPKNLPLHVLDTAFSGGSGMLFYDRLKRRILSPPVEKSAVSMGEDLTDDFFTMGDRYQYSALTGKSKLDGLNFDIPIINNYAIAPLSENFSIDYPHGSDFATTIKSLALKNKQTWAVLIKVEPEGYTVICASRLKITKREPEIAADKIVRLKVQSKCEIDIYTIARLYDQ